MLFVTIVVGLMVFMLGAMYGISVYNKNLPQLLAKMPDDKYSELLNEVTKLKTQAIWDKTIGEGKA